MEGKNNPNSALCEKVKRGQLSEQLHHLEAALNHIHNLHDRLLELNIYLTGDYPRNDVDKKSNEPPVHNTAMAKFDQLNSDMLGAISRTEDLITKLEETLH